MPYLKRQAESPEPIDCRILTAALELFVTNGYHNVSVHEVQKKADVSIGSRYVKGVNVVNWPMSRVLMSYFASKYVRLITRMKIHDTTAGFICYKRQVLETLNLDKIKFVGYAFQIEMKFKAYIKKFKLVEIPVIFTDRTKGKSKLSSGIISEAVFGVISLKFKSFFKK